MPRFLWSRGPLRDQFQVSLREIVETLLFSLVVVVIEGHHVSLKYKLFREAFNFFSVFWKNVTVTCPFQTLAFDSRNENKVERLPFCGSL